MIAFRLFGIPISIHPSFLLVAVFGLGAFEGIELVAWTVAVLLAVIVHELGHALTARAFGASTAITVFALGGYTTWSTPQPLPNGRRFAVAAAGSLAGIGLGAPFLYGLWQDWFDGTEPVVAAFVVSFVYASMFWGVLNWIPIRQLDGGHMVESLLAVVVPRHAEWISRVVSVVAGALAAVAAWRFGFQMAALFAVVLTLSDFWSPRRVDTGGPSRPPQPASRSDVDPPEEFPI